MSEWFDSENYNSDASPKKCKYCGGIHFLEMTKAVDSGYTSEFEIVCWSCSATVAYWAYGSYDPCFANLHPTEGP